jgi:uridine kinase
MRAAVLQALGDLVLRRSAARVAVDGVDAAGKTRLAGVLAALLELRGQTVSLVSIDGFLRPREERYRRGEESAEGYYLDSFDLGAFRRALDPRGRADAVVDNAVPARPRLRLAARAE